jgi:hypothetical protein
VVTAHVDGERRIVRLVVGDVRSTYPASAQFTRDQYRAPGPGDADVVIVNTYPMDVSLTFAYSKGFAPLESAAPSASRIAIAACSEGGGFHGLFPVVAIPRLQRYRHRIRTLVARPSRVPRLVARRLTGDRGRGATRGARTRGPIVEQRGPVHLLVTDLTHFEALRAPTEMSLTSEWPKVVARVDAEQRERRPLRVVIYGCAPLMVIGAHDSDDERSGASG